ncbi:MAG TPA: hypothetical protein VNA20_12820 [Frankiaceae bacterium]|nr:hypothetical protein [Frankiaceae bacterium]
MVAVPDDVEMLRRTDPDAARAWRHCVRAELGGALDGCWTVVGFGDAGYLLDAGGRGLTRRPPRGMLSP